MGDRTDADDAHDADDGDARCPHDCRCDCWVEATAKPEFYYHYYSEYDIGCFYNIIYFLYYTGYFCEFDGSFGTCTAGHVDGAYDMFEFVEFENLMPAIGMRTSVSAPRSRAHSECGRTNIKGVLMKSFVSDAEQPPASVPALLGESHVRALMIG